MKKISCFLIELSPAYFCYWQLLPYRASGRYTKDVAPSWNDGIMNCLLVYNRCNDIAYSFWKDNFFDLVRIQLPPSRKSILNICGFILAEFAVTLTYRIALKKFTCQSLIRVCTWVWVAQESDLFWSKLDMWSHYNKNMQYWDKKWAPTDFTVLGRPVWEFWVLQMEKN